MMENHKKYICFVLLEAYPYFNPSAGQMTGGAELQFFNLSTELAKKKKYNVSFIVGDYNQPQIETINEVKLIKSFNAKREDGFLKKIKQAIQFLKILKKEKPDVILSTTNNTLVVLCSVYSIFSKSKHIHRIAHNKDTGFERKEEFGILARLYSLGMKNANKILVQNKEQQMQLLKNFNKKSVLFKNAFLIKNQADSIKRFVLWVSRYQKWKQPELFVELAQKIPYYQFVMICPPPSGKIKDNWLKLREKSSETSNLEFIDYVPFSKIQTYFNKAQIFVNTSLAEGFPNTFLQATQAETPIVSLNVNPNSFITDYNCGIFCNNDYEYLVEKVSYLLNNKKELQKKGENSYLYLKENHDITAIAKQWEQIINEIV